MSTSLAASQTLVKLEENCLAIAAAMDVDLDCSAVAFYRGRSGFCALGLLDKFRLVLGIAASSSRNMLVGEPTCAGGVDP